MQIAQSRWNGAAWLRDGEALDGAQLVFVFGTNEALTAGVLEALRTKHPDAHILGCSTAGEIAGTRVYDGSVVATAVKLARGRVRAVSEEISDRDHSQDAGRRLAQKIPAEGLLHVFVLSDGTVVNGSELAKGMVAALPKGVAVTGGLSGDGARFGATHVCLDGPPRQKMVAAIGLYGEGLRVGYGSFGGWDPFGPERLVTRSHGSVVYELDGRPALDLYREYLGDHAAGLPASGLLFPLSLRTDAGGVVRTILNVDDATSSLVFAGDVPQGSYARLMMANFDRLIDGATGAARAAQERLCRGTAELAILISCVGRKLVLRQRVEEELETVQEVLGAGATLAGFYSYGEICPQANDVASALHNQTMTITTLSEVDCTSS